MILEFSRFESRFSTFSAKKQSKTCLTGLIKLSGFISTDYEPVNSIMDPFWICVWISGKHVFGISNISFNKNESQVAPRAKLPSQKCWYTNPLVMMHSFKFEIVIDDVHQAFIFLQRTYLLSFQCKK